MAGPVHAGAADDGTPTFLIDHAPSDLPAVRGRDILAAWDVARDAAGLSQRAYAFRFRRADGSWADLVLRDRDAIRWVSAADRLLGIHTSYGLSVCLRLLALINLLARASWAVGFVDLRGEASLHPGLLRLAAESSLTDDAGFDEPGFARKLCGPAGSGPFLGMSPP
jgi:hypothetical protein